MARSVWFSSQTILIRSARDNCFVKRNYILGKTTICGIKHQASESFHHVLKEFSQSINIRFKHSDVSIIFNSFIVNANDVFL